MVRKMQKNISLPPILPERGQIPSIPLYTIFFFMFFSRICWFTEYPNSTQTSSTEKKNIFFITFFRLPAENGKLGNEVIWISLIFFSYSKAFHERIDCVIFNERFISLCKAISRKTPTNNSRNLSNLLPSTLSDTKLIYFSVRVF